MLSWFLLLQYLNYISPEIGLVPCLTTEHCIVGKNRRGFRVVNEGVPTHDEIVKIKSLSAFENRPLFWVIKLKDLISQKVLEENGFEKYTFSGSVMVAFLDEAKVIYPSDITVEKINVYDNNALSKWIDIVGDTFNFNQNDSLKSIQLFNDTIKNGLFKLYLGFYKGEAVSAGMAIMHPIKVVSLHCIGTYSAFRKKGLASAITQKIMVDAQAEGCTSALLLANSKLESLYQNFGFKTYAQCAVYTL